MANLLLLLFTSFFCFAAHAFAHLNNKTVPALFIFGDSIVDTGNNDWLFTLARADFPPYGEDFVSHRPTGRFTDGQLAVDYIASFLGLPFVPPYLRGRDNILQGTNFASASSGILDTTGEQWGERLSLQEQVDLFKEMRNNLNDRLGIPEASLLLSKSLFIIATGSNDYITHYHASTVVNPNQKEYTTTVFQDDLLLKFTQKLVKLYKLGARKIALVSIPAVGCLPFQLYKSNGQCVSPLNQAVERYNVALYKTLTSLQASLAGSHFVYCDAFDLTLRLAENPAAYGFRDGKAACCGRGKYNGAVPCLPFITPVCKNASDHVFWDYVHPTSAAYRIVAQRWWQGSKPDVMPINLEQLAHT